MLVSPAMLAGATQFAPTNTSTSNDLTVRLVFQQQLGRLMAASPATTAAAHDQLLASVPRPTVAAPVFLPDINPAPASQAGGASAQRKDRKKSRKPSRHSTEQAGNR